MNDQTSVDLYLDLLAMTLTRALFEDNDRIVGIRSSWSGRSRATRFLDDYVGPLLGKAKLELVQKRVYNREER